jgi:hypothetical protein
LQQRLMTIGEYQKKSTLAMRQRLPPVRWASLASLINWLIFSSLYVFPAGMMTRYVSAIADFRLVVRLRLGEVERSCEGRRLLGGMPDGASDGRDRR